MVNAPNGTYETMSVICSHDNEGVLIFTDVLKVLKAKADSSRHYFTGKQ